MKYNLPLKSNEELTQSLVEIGLIIDNEEFAKNSFNSVGYFRLRKFMSHFILQESVGKYYFVKDTKFSDVQTIYDFDSKLRILIFEALVKIEVAIKSIMSYTMTTSFGSHWYLNKELFKKEFTENLNADKLSGYETFLSDLTENCETQEDFFIKRYRRTFTDPILPTSWMIMEILSFTKISKLYSNILPGQEKSKMAEHFGTHDRILETWLISLSYVRNLCAHHQKLILRNFTFPPIIPKRKNKRFLNDADIVDESKLYAILCIILYILSSLKINSSFKDEIKQLIHSRSKEELLSFGFSENWNDEQIWN